MSRELSKTCQQQDFVYATNTGEWLITCGESGERVDDNQCIRCPHLIRTSREENCKHQQYIRQIKAQL